MKLKDSDLRKIVREELIKKEYGLAQNLTTDRVGMVLQGSMVSSADVIDKGGRQVILLTLDDGQMVSIPTNGQITVSK